MFKHLAAHRKILVTGPHRSGTTFAATAIQHDLQSSHGLVREELCGFCQRGADYWLTNGAAVVVQAPFMADICHQYPQVFVVFMVRDVADIKKSQQRMWNEDGSSCDWARIERVESWRYHPTDEMPISDRKYAVWLEQRDRLPNYLELDYESLAAHPLWVAADGRKGFHVRQTSAVD